MAADAPWCTLCHTPRAAAEPARPAVPLASALAATNATLYAPVTRGAPADASPAWPCQGCGSDVPLAADLCPQCGAGFLGGAEATPTLNLPLVGDVTKRSKPAMYAIAAAVGTGIAMLLVSVVAVVALVF